MKKLCYSIYDLAFLLHRDYELVVRDLIACGVTPIYDGCPFDLLKSNWQPRIRLMGPSPIERIQRGAPKPDPTIVMVPADVLPWGWKTRIEAEEKEWDIAPADAPRDTGGPATVARNDGHVQGRSAEALYDHAGKEFQATGASEDPIQSGGDVALMPDRSSEDVMSVSGETTGDREPMLSKGPNRRERMAEWITWCAHSLQETGDDAKRLAERISLRAERFGYQSERGPLKDSSIIRQLPRGLFGPRGRKPGGRSRKQLGVPN